MTPKTLRRKLQKKCKRRHYGKCPRCGNRTEKSVESVESNHPQGFLPRLVIECYGRDNYSSVGNASAMNGKRQQEQA